MEKFTHSPLDLDRPAIRLLQILQGSGPDIECELFQAYLDDDHDVLIPYEALSYTWGGTDMSKSVQIDSKTQDITENLYLALQHLRLPDRDRILWVDALCIDQSNIEERGHQVGQMGSIYSRAHRILVWLGLGTNETALLLDNLAQLHKFGMRSWALADVRWSEAWHALSPGWEILHPRLHDRHNEGLQTLLANPWFKRVWILQEVANAKRATIYVGEKSIPAQMLALAPRLINLHPQSHCQAVLDILPGQAREHSWWSKRRDLCTLLHKFRKSEASHSHDTIYALLGMCSDGHGVRPDYTKSFPQVVHETAIFLFDLPNRAEYYTMHQAVPCAVRHNIQTLEMVVRSENLNWIDAFVRSRSQLLVFGPNELEAASSNTTWGSRIVPYLLEHPKVHVQLSEAMLLAAARDDMKDVHPLRLLHGRYGKELLVRAAAYQLRIMALLFEEQDLNIDVTTPALVAAASNDEAGVEVMELLLKGVTDISKVTSHVIKAAARNPVCGPELMNLLLTHLAYLGQGISVGGEMVEILRLNPRTMAIWTCLLTRDNPFNIELTVQALVALAHPQRRSLSSSSEHETVLKHQQRKILASNGLNQSLEKQISIQKRIWELIIPWLGDRDIEYHVLVMLAMNDQCGTDILTMLLVSRQFETIITQQVLVAATTAGNQGARLIESILRPRNSRTKESQNYRRALVETEANQRKIEDEAWITSRVIEALVPLSGTRRSLLKFFSVQLTSSPPRVTRDAFLAAKYIVRALARALWRLLDSSPGFKIKRGTRVTEKYRFNIIGHPPPPEWDEAAHTPSIAEEWYSQFDPEWEPCLSQPLSHTGARNKSLDDIPWYKIDRYSDPDASKTRRRLEIGIHWEGSEDLRHTWTWNWEERSSIECVYREWMTFAKILYAIVRNEEE